MRTGVWQQRWGAAVGRVLRDGAVRSALVTGVVIGLSALFVGARYPWQFAVMGAVWLVATVLRVRNVLVRPVGAAPSAETGTPSTPDDATAPKVDASTSAGAHEHDVQGADEESPTRAATGGEPGAS